MKKIFALGLVLIMLVGITGTALAFNSGSNPGATGLQTIEWTGQGGLGDPADFCPDDSGYAADPDSYLHWILTTDGGSADSAVLTLGGNGSGEYIGTPTGGAFHFYTPYFDLEGGLLTASADINVVTTGNGAWILTISQGCAGDADYEELTVSKTVETSYTRTHDWSIAKSVSTENGFEHEGFPKVWLYIDGSGNETATWTVDVTYEGFVDSDFNVSGEITIENTGTLDAVITSIEDVLAGTSISVDCAPFVMGDTLPAGETLTCTYSENGEFIGKNVATVTTERDTYSGEADIVWGAPSVELNETVTVKDNSDLFGEKDFGTVTAPDNFPFTYTFTYTKAFTWADYGQANCGDHTYDNTASVISGVETLDSASATLKVNVQCYIFETAYAKDSDGICFLDEFKNWGWTNPLTAGEGSVTWDLWAGAGQCDTSKSTLVGSVTVDYDGNNVTVTYNVASPYLLDDTHVYAGTGKYPLFNGKITVAPGKYYNLGNFGGSPVYVIAHAVVGIPDPNFGP